MLHKLVVSISLVLICLSVPSIALAQDTEAGIDTTHTVQSGETLYSIAQQYGFTVDALAAANGIVNPNQIFVGQVLVIPVSIGGGQEQPAPEQTAIETETAVAQETLPTTHEVLGGETLASIGRLYGIPWTELARINGITNPNQVLPGQILALTESAVVEEVVVEEESSAPESPTEAVVEETPVEEATPTGDTVHVVQANEGLAVIARAYGVNWTVIADANGITDPNLITPGQELIIPNPSLTPVSDYGSPAPSGTVDNGRMILVDLTNQQIMAYENGNLIRQTTVSTGLPGTPTVTGDFYIYSKLPSQTMYGPGYYLPGVQWVMYFYQGYAIHGAYWHNNFGQPMSHGCVNLPNEDAEWFYTFASLGTLVRVTY